MHTIKIDQGQMAQLYETLYNGEIQSEMMIEKLAAFKENLEAQGFADSSLSQTVDYADALINLMETLAQAVVVLQENASKIATYFAEVDERTDVMKSVKSYDDYIADRLTNNSDSIE